MVKKLLYILIALVALLVLGLVIAVVSINSIARAGIEKGGTYALGVDTTVNSASVGLLSGKFGMSGLNVANPAGFRADKFLSLGDGGVQVSLGTLSQDVVTLPTLTLDTLEVNLEKAEGKSNYGVILENLKKVSGPSDPSKPAPPDEGKKFIIKDLRITNIVVRMDLVGGSSPVGELTKVTVPIDEIKLQNVGQTGEGVAGSGVTIGQLASIIVQAILAAAVEKGGGLIPADVLGDLQGRLAALGDLDKLGMSVLGDAKGTLEKVGSEATKAVEEGKKKLDEIGKGIGDLIPGGDKDKKK